MKILVKILLITLWIAIAAGVVVMMSFANVTHEVKQCRGITCRIDYRGAQPLMSGNDLITQIKYGFDQPNILYVPQSLDCGLRVPHIRGLLDF